MYTPHTLPTPEELWDTIKAQEEWYKSLKLLHHIDYDLPTVHDHYYNIDIMGFDDAYWNHIPFKMCWANRADGIKLLKHVHPNECIFEDHLSCPKLCTAVYIPEDEYKIYYEVISHDYHHVEKLNTTPPDTELHEILAQTRALPVATRELDGDLITIHGTQYMRHTLSQQFIPSTVNVTFNTHVYAEITFVLNDDACPQKMYFIHKSVPFYCNSTHYEEYNNYKSIFNIKKEATLQLPYIPPLRHGKSRIWHR